MQCPCFSWKSRKSCASLAILSFWNMFQIKVTYLLHHQMQQEDYFDLVWLYCILSRTREDLPFVHSLNERRTIIQFSYFEDAGGKNDFFPYYRILLTICSTVHFIHISNKEVSSSLCVFTGVSSFKDHLWYHFTCIDVSFCFRRKHNSS